MKTVKQVEGHELYYVSTCSYCVIVRLSLWWFGIKIPLNNIVTQPRSYIDLVSGGGKSQVPCLRIENIDGDVRWMYESAEIIRYFKTVY